MSRSSSPASSSLSVYFLHPDLGIGGAERLIIDAALGLQNSGHRVQLFTSHHSAACAFQETNDGSLAVHVFGDFLPTSFFGRFKLFFAIIRQFYLSLAILLCFPRPDLFIVDQLAAAMPLLRLFSSARILFYCHFPDLLLSSRSSWLKKVYRWPLDFLEEFTTGFADVILVNSAFTRKIFYETFPSMKYSSRHANVKILYPAINFDKYKPSQAYLSDPSAAELRNFPADRILLTSINRFERKKNIQLAIQALALIKEKRVVKSVSLLIAGGFDPLNRENVSHYPELKSISASFGLSVSDYPSMSGDVIFLRSFTESQRFELFRRSTAILYTPANEHFGIVPVEAMFNEKLVIAINSGGPMETIDHGITGFLTEDSPDKFAAAIESVLLKSPADRSSMGSAGRRRVIDKFSLDNFTAQLNSIIRTLVEQSESNSDSDSDAEAEANQSSMMKLLFGMMIIAAITGIYWE